MDIVKVQFPNKKNKSGYGGGEYSYTTTMPLKAGDIVNAPTKSGCCKAKVVSVKPLKINSDDAKELGIGHITELADIVDVESSKPNIIAAHTVMPLDSTTHPCPELPIFRIIAREFYALSDDYVCQWIELTRPWVGRRVFRRLTPQAVAVLTAHRLKLAQFAEDFASYDNLPLASISEDDASESYATNLLTAFMNDNSLLQTDYGKQFLAMRQPGIWA